MSREWKTRYYIADGLKCILQSAKKGNDNCVEFYYVRLLAIVSYMVFVGDISEEVGDRVIKLAKLINRKYNKYRV